MCARARVCACVQVYSVKFDEIDEGEVTVAKRCICVCVCVCAIM